MKNSLLLLAMAAFCQGCAAFGNATKVRDEQAGLDIHCTEPRNKYTPMVGFGSVVLDTHNIPTWEEPKGHDERTQPYRVGKPGCLTGKFTTVQDPHAEQSIICYEACNAYTKEHGFAALKFDHTPQFQKEDEYTVAHRHSVPLKTSRDESNDTETYRAAQ